MTSVAATEFTRNFGRYLEEAQRGPVEITAHDRVAGYFVSAHEYDELQRIKYRPTVRRVEDLDDETLEALRTVRMDPRHDHLNALLD